MIEELVVKNRSVRRYDNSKKLDRELLLRIVDSARLCANAGNRQRIRYALVTGEDTLEKIRECLGFAAYLKDWGGPVASENPTGYIVMLTEEEDFNLYIDIGIASSTMLLLGCELGIGGCIFRSFNKDKIAEILGTEKYMPRLVISFGVPAERFELSEVQNDDIKYFRRQDGTHVVPKLSLADVVIIEK